MRSEKEALQKVERELEHEKWLAFLRAIRLRVLDAENQRLREELEQARSELASVKMALALAVVLPKGVERGTDEK